MAVSSIKKCSVLAGVRVAERGRQGSFDPAALLLLLPRVREDADGARQDEQPARERRFKAEFAVDHCGRAVDVHRKRLAGALFERAFEQTPDLRVTACDV